MKISEEVKARIAGVWNKKKLYDTARRIYESVSFTGRLNGDDDDNEGPLLDEEVEHYG